MPTMLAALQTPPASNSKTPLVVAALGGRRVSAPRAGGLPGSDESEECPQPLGRVPREARRGHVAAIAALVPGHLEQAAHPSLRVLPAGQDGTQDTHDPAVEQWLVLCPARGHDGLK